jgi:hypothetical protein
MRLFMIFMLLGCGANERTEANETGNCAGDGWCWERGRPMIVSGDFEVDSVYAIGPEGAFLRWESDHWIAEPVPTTRTLTSGLVRSPRDMWVTDDAGTAWHFDGVRWTEELASVPIVRMVGTQDGDVWAHAGASMHGASAGGALVRREGDAWVQPMEPFPYCLGGDFLVREGGVVWSVGLVCEDGGGPAAEVHRYDGTRWERVGEPIPSGWVYFLRSTDAVRIGGFGTYEWDGTAWRAVEPSEDASPALPDSLDCRRSFGVDDAHTWCYGAAGISFHDGRSWRATLEDPFADTQPTDRWGTIPPALWAGSDTFRAWGAGPDDVYRARVSTGRALEHFDGTAWNTLTSDRVHDIDGTSAGDVWFATEEGLLVPNARCPVRLPLGADEPALRVRALGAAGVLVMTRSSLLAYDGTWSTLYTAPDHSQLVTMAAHARDDIWVVQNRAVKSVDSALLHYDGRAWAEVELGGRVVEVVTAGDETWATVDRELVELASGARVPLPHFSGSLSLTADRLWLHTPTQALSHPRP